MQGPQHHMPQSTISTLNAHRLQAVCTGQLPQWWSKGNSTTQLLISAALRPTPPSSLLLLLLTLTSTSHVKRNRQHGAGSDSFMGCLGT
jgi:hypothetical protein